MSETDQAKLDAAESIGVTAAVKHLRETNAPSISERVIQAFLCSKPDAEATHLADTAPKLLAALRDGVNEALGDNWRIRARAAIAEAEGRQL